MSFRADLPIWAGGGEAPLNRIRAAKDRLGLDLTVVPCGAAPGVVGRVLAWGVAPTWLCDYAQVDPLGTDEELDEALAWVLGERESCWTQMSVLDMLSVLCGPGVREITPEELLSEQRLREYQQGV